MPEDPIRYQEMASKIISVLKEMASKSQQVNPTNLAKFLAARPEMERYLPGSAPRFVSGPLISTPLALAAPGRDFIDSPDIGRELRDAYLALLEILALDLAQGFIAQIRALKIKVAAQTDPHTLLALRPQIEEVVRLYARQVYEERNKAASFAAEVMHHLADLEGQFLETSGQTGQLLLENESFNQGLDSHLEKMNHAITDSSHMEEMKAIVLGSLSHMRQALEKKRREDRGRLSLAQAEADALQAHLDAVRKQIALVQEENRTLLSKVRRDALTGAYNRPALWEALFRELNRLDRYGRVFSLAMLDVDNFKKINDDWGHTVGDQCLVEIVHRVAEVLRKSDFLARYGGEEFVVILPETNLAQGREVAEKIRRAIDHTDFLFRGRKVPVSVSLGVTQAAPGDQRPEDLVDRADRALYQAKNAGRNRVEVLPAPDHA
ncbi:MAG: GGDEF domain-containing protein [Deltaproteobacteria bacterium]|nr:GGDEF domain-containing protein [Deltaproteobacteria bacterium]